MTIEALIQGPVQPGHNPLEVCPLLLQLLESLPLLGDLRLYSLQLGLFLGQLPDAAGDQVLKLFGECPAYLPVDQLGQLVRKANAADVVFCRHDHHAPCSIHRDK